MNTPTNYNQPDPTPNYGAPSGGDNNSQKRLITIMGVAIGLLLLVSIYLIVSKYATGRQLDATQTELNEQKAAFEELDLKYNETVTELEKQKGLNAELDAKINEQLAQLDADKARIEDLIRQNRNYKGAMAKFEQQRSQYMAEIEDLKAQVGLLTEKTEQLSSENEQLSSNLSDTRVQLEETQSAKAALISEKTQLETERNFLGQKVDIASAIKVKDIQVKAVSVTSSGKERSKSKAKKVDKLNICFNTTANEVVESGEETFYITVIDPTGVPLYLETMGSGVGMDKKRGEEFRYTTSASVQYANEPVNACGSWEPGANFVKGKYTVEIYNKGYKVGSGAFQLK